MGKMEFENSKDDSKHDVSEWKKPKGDIANLFRSHRDLSSTHNKSGKFLHELFEATVRNIPTFYQSITHTHTYTSTDTKKTSKIFEKRNETNLQMCTNYCESWIQKF